MPPLRHVRKSRRLSIKSLLNDCQALTDPLELLHSGPDAAITAPVSPSASTSSNSPPSVLSHLPFTPGSSHTRNRKEGHIPRPPNAFMVFRSWLWNKDNLKNIEKDNRNVSRIAGRYWNELSEAERAPFRSMAEEAKARHAQLYPEYKYAPGSQKRIKIVPRRSQRADDGETEKCKKLADLLLGGVTGRELARYLDDDPAKVKREQEDAHEPASELNTSRKVFIKLAAPRTYPSPKRNLKIRKQRKDLYSPEVSAPPFQPMACLPDPADTDDMLEDTPTPMPTPKMHTPELVYPADDADEFVATDDIPYLSLDDCDDAMIKAKQDEDFSTFVPSHMKPAAHTVLTGIKPESAIFADACVLGAYTINTTASSSPISFSTCDIDPYCTSTEMLVPFGSPIFTNPFQSGTSSAEYEALLGTLDQLFGGQPISPLSLPTGGC